MTVAIAGFAALLVASMFFSAAEIAATMASRVRLRTRAEQGQRGARRAEHLLEHPERPIVTCLVGNTLVNVAMATLARSMVMAIHPMEEAWADLVATAFTVPLVLVLGEALPKALAQTYPNRTLAALAVPLAVVHWVLWPLAQVAFGVARLARRLGGMRSQVFDFLSREELKQFVSHSEKQGHVDADERDLIYQIFEFWKLDPARLVQRLEAVPRTGAATPAGAVKERMRSERLHRLVVTDPAGREVLGVVTARSLLDVPNNAAVQDFVLPPVRASLAQGIDRLLTELQRSPSQTAVVKSGNDTGIIALDELLQQLLGRAASAVAAGVPTAAHSRQETS
jgi:CBS domain containing-hemolysin-like protein